MKKVPKYTFYCFSIFRKTYLSRVEILNFHVKEVRANNAQYLPQLKICSYYVQMRILCKKQDFVYESAAVVTSNINHRYSFTT